MSMISLLRVKHTVCPIIAMVEGRMMMIMVEGEEGRKDIVGGCSSSADHFLVRTEKLDHGKVGYFCVA